MRKTVSRIETAHKIEIMQAWLDGVPLVMTDRATGDTYGVRKHVDGYGDISWNWHVYEYALAPVPASIDWDAVSEEFTYLAIDGDGRGFLYSSLPTFNDSAMAFSATNGVMRHAGHFASFSAGTAGPHIVKRDAGVVAIVREV